MPIGVYEHKRKDRTCPTDHGEYFARGMCKPCYDAWYRSANLQTLKDYQKKRYGTTKSQLAAYHLKDQRERRSRQKIQALQKYGPNGQAKCAWPGCDVDDADCLVLDHVEDDGRKRRNIGERRGNGLYASVLRYDIPGLQVLCANHNLKKEIQRRAKLRQ